MFKAMSIGMDGKSAADKALIANYPLGGDLVDTVGGQTGTLLRASGKNIQKFASDLYRHFNDNLAAFTGKAINLEGTGTNKCTNYNLAPDAGLTNITDGTNLTTTRVTDETELRAAGFGDLIDSGVMPSSYVFKTVSVDASSERNVVISGLTGNTNPHSARIFARSDTGLAIQLFVGVAVGGSLGTPQYKEIKADGFTPTAGTNDLRIRISPLDTVYWFGNQLEESSEVESLIETQGTSGTRDLDNLKLELGIPVNDFSIYGNIKGWSQVGAMVSQAVLQNKESSSNQWQLRNSATGSQTIGFYQTIGGSIKNVFADTGGEDFDFLIKKSSTDGVTLITDFDSDNNPTMTGDVALPQLLTQVGNSDSLANPSNLELSNLRSFNGTDITLEEARAAGNP